jgi:hypothetical protein
MLCPERLATWLVAARTETMRYALIIAMFLAPAFLAQAEPLDRDKWVGQTARANKSCLAKFRQKFGKRRTAFTLTV